MRCDLVWRQLDAIRKGRIIELVFKLVGRDPGHCFGRNAIADRRIAGRQNDAFQARKPPLTGPAQNSVRLSAANRQNVACRLSCRRILLKSRQNVFGSDLKSPRESPHKP